ncbi:transposase [Kitasatospora sp. cg17-2]
MPKRRTARVRLACTGRFPRWARSGDRGGRPARRQGLLAAQWVSVPTSFPGGSVVVLPRHRGGGVHCGHSRVRLPGSQVRERRRPRGPRAPLPVRHGGRRVGGGQASASGIGLAARGRGGQPAAYCRRAILDAIRCPVDNGTKWNAIPIDFPPWERVYAFFRRRRDHGLVKEFHDRLRRQVRAQAGRDPEPSAGVIDSPSVKADAVVGADSRGFDGGKPINGGAPGPAPRGRGPRRTASGTSWSTRSDRCSR